MTEYKLQGPQLSLSHFNLLVFKRHRAILINFLELLLHELFLLLLPLNDIVVALTDAGLYVRVSSRLFYTWQFLQVAIEQILALKLLEYVEYRVGHCEALLEEVYFTQLPL